MSPFPISILFLLLTTLTLALPQTTRDTSSTQYTSDTSFRAAVLNGTNTYRAQHNATSLSWNDTLADVAREWSEKCEWKHSGGPYGENLATGYPNTTASIDAWAAERSKYDFSGGKFGTETGHFTQLVWKSTRAVGCGRTLCNGGTDGDARGWFVVCEYWPGGNVIGRFRENVQEQEGGAVGVRRRIGAVWVGVVVVVTCLVM